MKTRYLIAAAALSLSANTFAADAGPDLFKKHNCVMCHKVDQSSTGPALKAIASHYAGDKGAQAKLEAKVRSGGSGTFGKMPMTKTPPSVSDADIKVMVSWILSQK